MPANSSLLRVLIALLLIIIVLPLSQASGVNTPLPELLGPTLAAASTAQPGGAEQRGRTAVLNLAEVERTRADLDAGRTPVALALSLFADTNLVARFEHIEHLQSGGYSLSGRIDGSPFAEIHLSVVGGGLYASLNTPQGLFRISSADGRTTKITQVDPRLLPPEEERVPAAAPAAADVLAPTAVTAGPTATDDGSRIDVYVGYTATARAQAGGAAAIQALIATALTETNTGYANSGINQRVVLVGSGEYAYSEAGFNWDTTLNRWSNPGDAIFGPAHTLRNSLKADEMVLLVGDPNYCGLAWLMDSGSISTAFAANSFGVVSWSCATGYYSFGHEMGHNMGAHHDRYTASGNQGAFSYSYGFWIFNPVTSRYDRRTIMAYNTAAAYGYNSTRINYWSNPSVNYNGQPTGVSELAAQSANNALTLNNTAPFVAMFRDGNAPAAPTNLTVTSLSATSNRLDWADTSADEMRFRIERTLSSPVSWAEIGIANANTTTYTDNTAVSGINYQYRVLSDNGNGRSVSNTGTSAPPLPAAPSALTATGLSQTSFKLNWKDNATTEDGYKVGRSLDGGASYLPLATLPANTQVYNDTAAACGVNSYRVYAYNTAGNSVYTTTSGTTTPCKPVLTAAPGTTTIYLSWAAVSGAQGYHVDQWDTIAGDFVTISPIITIAAPTSFVVSGLTKASNYRFRVVAVSTLGDTPSDPLDVPTMSFEVFLPIAIR